MNVSAAAEQPRSRKEARAVAADLRVDQLHPVTQFGIHALRIAEHDEAILALAADALRDAVRTRSGLGPRQKAVLALLDAVNEQHPGAWLPQMEIISGSDESLLGSIRRAVDSLVKSGHIEGVYVTHNRSQGHFVRVPQRESAADLNDIQHEVNHVLARVGHRVKIEYRYTVDTRIRPDVSDGRWMYRVYSLRRDVNVTVSTMKEPA